MPKVLVWWPQKSLNRAQQAGSKSLFTEQISQPSENQCSNYEGKPELQLALWKRHRWYYPEIHPMLWYLLCSCHCIYCVGFWTCCIPNILLLRWRLTWNTFSENAMDGDQIPQLTKAYFICLIIALSIWANHHLYDILKEMCALPISVIGETTSTGATIILARTWQHLRQLGRIPKCWKAASRGFRAEDGRKTWHLEACELLRALVNSSALRTQQVFRGEFSRCTQKSHITILRCTEKKRHCFTHSLSLKQGASWVLSGFLA